MNRIQKINNIYNVLITPSLEFDSDIGFMVSNWIDHTLSGYNVLSYNSLSDALNKAEKYPDLNWLKFVLIQKDYFVYVNNILVNNYVKKYNIPYKHFIMDPDELKQTFFNRVITYGKQFRPCHHLNDMMLFELKFTDINLLNHIMKLIYSNHNLTIYKVIYNKYNILLIGKTDNSLTYTINLIYSK